MIPDAPGGKDIFFPERGQPHMEAQMVCFGCPVRNNCEDYRTRTGQQWGVWGGKTTQR
jgi:WhiB family redox-sensing transcriptional regulator